MISHFLNNRNFRGGRLGYFLRNFNDWQIFQAINVAHDLAVLDMAGSLFGTYKINNMGDTSYGRATISVLCISGDTFISIFFISLA